MDRLVLASNNQGKLKELQSLFAPLGLNLVAQSEFATPEAEEPFHTFVENALAKARHASRHTGLPAIADDAGLCVDAFGGQPGVQTAYYAVQCGLPKGDDHNVTALLHNMKGIANRRAALVSTLVAVRSPEDPEPLIAVGRAPGLITQERIGSNGFGFDPVMWIEAKGKTFAQMSDDEKNAISHRGRAAQKMVELIQSQWLS
ncbi:MAG: RdgB/HAM1 family non-canonical purine NTP pyrophosphatase [Betaproteobacteria bacterium]|jgi:XTP/dITP diphosphohydrolase|nr:RdgB/HAM1 family non-canonical purine NTP pyrophosphatase [Betaproteobacteria bacterium]NBP45566.1 RdgB/HAM1 family non-canonical purine NTP pyrophosphatase [Betaproteobacteria bacterium]